MANIQDEFGWAIPLTKEDEDYIWENAILTVDTNVLLDLYRYHPKTRNSILKILERFKERLWISHQVMKEFCKNRGSVIADSIKNFDEGEELINSLSSKVLARIDELLRSNRSISRDLIDAIKIKVSESINETIKSERDVSTKVSFSNDPIILQIIKRFEGKVGEKFSDKKLTEVLSIAEDRFKNKIPPGYKDNDKEGEAKYGDYLLWEQILCYVEKNDKPIIFVTSEKKEDWWEIKSGKTVGLRNELKQEYWERTSKKPDESKSELQQEYRERLHRHILVYQTEYFLETIAKKESEQIRKDELNDAIRDVQQLNFNKLKQKIVNNVRQDTEFSSDYYSSGYIQCEIDRPTDYFTLTGHLKPHLNGIPTIDVELIKSPKSYYDAKVYGGTGTRHDFHIHMNSSREKFVAGLYKFKYTASVESSSYEESVASYCPECGEDYFKCGCGED